MDAGSRGQSAPQAPNAVPIRHPDLTSWLLRLCHSLPLRDPALVRRTHTCATAAPALRLLRLIPSSVDRTHGSKRRNERFDSEDQLRSWLEEDQVSWKPEDLAAALGDLEAIGRLRRPRQDQWGNQPLPGIYVPARIFNE
jgi:hypothetical protein